MYDSIKTRKTFITDTDFILSRHSIPENELYGFTFLPIWYNEFHENDKNSFDRLICQLSYVVYQELDTYLLCLVHVKRWKIASCQRT
jgi:hypothetical protein